MKLSFKFFLAFLLTSLTIVVLMVVIVQLYAYRNFSSYIAKMELLRLRNLASRLSEEYRKDNGWEKLKNSPRRWRELANLHQEPPDFFKEQMPGGPCRHLCLRMRTGTRHCTGTGRHLMIKIFFVRGGTDESLLMTEARRLTAAESRGIRRMIGG